MSEKRLLRVDEMARRLNCSEKTIRRMIQNGSIDSVRIGKREHRIDEHAAMLKLNNNKK